MELRALTLAALLMLAGCSSGDSGPYDSAEAAVRAHLAAARSGDVAALRSDSCGALAEEMARHSDDEVRVAFGQRDLATVTRERLALTGV